MKGIISYFILNAVNGHIGYANVPKELRQIVTNMKDYSLGSTQKELPIILKNMANDFAEKFVKEMEVNNGNRKY